MPEPQYYTVPVQGLPYKMPWTGQKPPQREDFENFADYVASRPQHQIAAYQAHTPQLPPGIDPQVVAGYQQQWFGPQSDPNSTPAKALAKILQIHPDQRAAAVAATGFQPVGQAALLQEAWRQNSFDYRLPLATNIAASAADLGVTPEAARAQGVAPAVAGNKAKRQQLLQQREQIQNPPMPMNGLAPNAGGFDAASRVANQQRLDEINQQLAGLTGGTAQPESYQPNPTPAHIPPVVGPAIANTVTGDPGTYEQLASGGVPGKFVQKLLGFAEPESLATMAALGPLTAAGMGPKTALSLFGGQTAGDAALALQRGDKEDAIAGIGAFLAPFAVHGALHAVGPKPAAPIDGGTNITPEDVAHMQRLLDVSPDAQPTVPFERPPAPGVVPRPKPSGTPLLEPLPKVGAQAAPQSAPEPLLAPLPKPGEADPQSTPMAQTGAPGKSSFEALQSYVADLQDHIEKRGDDPASAATYDPPHGWIPKNPSDVAHVALADAYNELDKHFDAEQANQAGTHQQPAQPAEAPQIEPQEPQRAIPQPATEPEPATTVPDGMEHLTAEQRAYAMGSQPKEEWLPREAIARKDEVFQFRRRTVADFPRWNPREAAKNPISVWTDEGGEIGEAGQRYVVNGHNRMVNAEKFDVPALRVRYLEAQTAREARAMGAIENILDSPRNDSLDVARFLRDTETTKGQAAQLLSDAGVSMQSRLMREAASLAKLPDPIWDTVYREADTTPGLKTLAAAVVEHFPPEEQEAAFADLYNKLDGGEKFDPKLIEQKARIAKAARDAAAQGGFGFDLGDADVRAKIVTAVKDHFASLLNGARGARRKIVADRYGLPDISDLALQDKQTQFVIDQNAHRATPLGERITQAVHAITAGEDQNHVTAQLIRELEDGSILRDTLAERSIDAGGAGEGAGLRPGLPEPSEGQGQPGAAGHDEGNPGARPADGTVASDNGGDSRNGFDFAEPGSDGPEQPGAGAGPAPTDPEQGHAPPVASFADWVDRTVAANPNIAGDVYTKARDLYPLWKAEHPEATRESFGQQFQELAASDRHEVVTPSGNVKKGDVFSFQDSTGTSRRVTGVRPREISAKDQQVLDQGPQELGAGVPLDKLLRPVFGDETVESGKAFKIRFQDAVHATFDPSSMTAESAQTARMGRDYNAQLAQRYEVAKAALDKIQAKFDRMPEADRLAFIDAIEQGGQQATPELQAVADTLRRVLDSTRDDIRALGTGALDNFLDNYFPHLWKDPAKAATTFAEVGGKRPWEGSKAFLKKRTLPTTADGIAAGLKPVTTNPILLTRLKLYEMNRYLMAQRWFNEMKQQGIAKFVPEMRPPDGYAEIDDRIARVIERRETTKADGSPGAPEYILRGKWVAPVDAARVLNNHLSPGWGGKPVYQAVQYLNNAMNMAQLGLSGFHATGVSINAVASEVGRAIMKVQNGDVIGAGKTLAGAPIAPITKYFKGKQVLSAYLGKAPVPSQIMPIADAVVRAGGRSTLDPVFRLNSIEHFTTALRERNARGVIWHSLGAALEGTMGPLMRDFVPKIKLGVFAGMAEDALAKLPPDATVDQQRAALAPLWDNIDNRFGQLAYDNLFWGRSLKDAGHIAVRSLGWNLGTLRELGGAAVDVATTGSRRQAGGPLFTNKMAYTMGLTFTTALLGATYQYLHTGKPPQEPEDYIHPRDSKGNRVQFPTYLRDVAGYATDPLKTISHKTSPIINVFTEMAQNKDFYGQPIRNTDDPAVRQAQEYFHYLTGQFVPFSFRPAKKGEPYIAPFSEPWIEQKAGIVPYYGKKRQQKPSAYR